MGGVVITTSRIWEYFSWTKRVLAVELTLAMPQFLQYSTLEHSLAEKMLTGQLDTQYSLVEVTKINLWCTSDGQTICDITVVIMVMSQESETVQKP